MVRKPPLKKLKREEGERSQQKQQKKRPFPRRKANRLAEEEEIAALEARIDAGAPARGSNPLASSIPPPRPRPPPHKPQQQQDEEGAELAPYVGATLFEQLPISDRTRRGLADAKFRHMTEIQRAALPHALCGRDVLGAAKTGSGKTLAFLIPVVEKLFRLRWGSMDGVGAIIISPTRELAVQIFEELRKVGKHHSISGGLLIGGRKDVSAEKERVNRLNILVCTPGRLLQHMDETPNFDCTQLQVLVLDEADRILDMGFANTLNAIVAQLPKQRQTLLFSATQTRSVQDLARLSLKDPEYLAVHAESTVATPARLQQTAMVVPLDEKIDMLWSFIKTHLRSKTLIFLSSCKQVKFVHESFKKLRPGVPLRCLHGRMKQTQRMLVFFKFCEEKHSVLFATDVAARGLDFPAVDWVVQMDCPEDVPSYIHRVGRTARYKSGGHSVLFLCPSESKMIGELKAAKIPIRIIKANESKIQRVSGAMAGLLSKDPDLKYMAQRAFVTYLRSIHVRADNEIFDVMKLPLEEYAVSLGLPTTPRIRFLKKGSKRAAEKDDKAGKSAITAEGSNLEELPNQEVGKRRELHLMDKDDKLFLSTDDHSAENNRVERTLLSKGLTGSTEGGFLTKKIQKSQQDDLAITQDISLGTRVNKKKKLKINPNRPVGKRFVFDEEGNAVPPLAAFASEGQDGDDTTDAHNTLEDVAKERYRKLKDEMRQRDKQDKLHEKQRLREKRNKQKKKPAQTDGHAEHVVLASFDDNENPQSGRKRYFSSGSSDESEGSEDWADAADAGRQRSDPRESRAFHKLDNLPLSVQESIALNMLKAKS